MKETRESQRFYDLVWPHAKCVLRSARILTRGSTEAEDLAQETLLKAFVAIDSFQKATNARAWLMAILRNAHIDRLRAGGRKTKDVSLSDLTVEPPDASSFGVGPTKEPQWDNPQARLQEFSDQEVIDALQRLPEEIRWTLLLVDVEGWSQDDAARLLEVPVGTIKSRAHRGRAMLRGTLRPVAEKRRLIRD